jgi:hypothetical protein
MRRRAHPVRGEGTIPPAAGPVQHGEPRQPELVGGVVHQLLLAGVGHPVSGGTDQRDGRIVVGDAERVGEHVHSVAAQLLEQPAASLQLLALALGIE